MTSILRDLVLSFCPAAVRKAHRPESEIHALWAAMVSGLLQFLWFTLVSALRYKSYFISRAAQLAPQTAGAGEIIQSGMAILVSLEYLVHPIAALLIYLAGEGFVRFMGSLVFSEIVPSFPVFILFTLKTAIRKQLLARQPAVPDIIEVLPNGPLKIVASQPKASWTLSITIGVQGDWYEVEREEYDAPVRKYVYFLRRASPGKILRGFEELEIGPASQSALTSLYRKK